MKLTPVIVEAAYDFLRMTPPFNRWKLPSSDHVEFLIIKEKRVQGSYSRWVAGPQKGVHIIGVSQQLVNHTAVLMKLIAHEMVHLRQADRGTETPGTEHNAEFHRLTKLVCKHHGWDEGDF